jgi:transposase-like protein
MDFIMIKPKHGFLCPNCGSSTIIKTGKRKTIQGLVQIYYCKKCRKYSSDKKLRYKSYNPEIILQGITNYNLGYRIEEANKLINRRYKKKVPQSTLYSWIKGYEDICTFTRLRRKYKIEPDRLIKSGKLYHQQVYNFKYHWFKVNLIGKRFPGLKKYIQEVVTSCPHNLFQKGPRCSNLHLNIKPRKSTKNNNALKLAELALILAKRNHERHEKIQDFMLVNDSATVAVEVPVFLLPREVKGVDLSVTLTGHIDILQVRYDKIHILDYKPGAMKERKAAEQVFLYTLALSKRTGIPLNEFRCAYFEDSVYYEFNPSTTYPL